MYLFTYRHCWILLMYTFSFEAESYDPEILGPDQKLIIFKNVSHGENGGALGRVPVIINPIYTLYSGYLFGISPFKGLWVSPFQRFSQWDFSQEWRAPDEEHSDHEETSTNQGADHKNPFAPAKWKVTTLFRRQKTIQKSKKMRCKSRDVLNVIWFHHLFW